MNYFRRIINIKGKKLKRLLWVDLDSLVEKFS